MKPPTFLHPFSSPSSTEFINIVGGKGSEIWDDQGNRYLDGLASLWYVNVGHGHPKMIEAIGKQAGELCAYHTFDPFTNPAADRVAEAIVSRSPMPDGRVFLSSSGSEAVDTAIKLARLTQILSGHPEKTIIISRDRAYHGTNLGGTSAQGIEPNRQGWGPLVPDVIQIPPDNIEELSRLFSQQGDQIAAVLTEPVQGAGGVYPPPPGYLEGIRKLCNTHGALLIHDEVITGFGRLGTWFGSQHLGVTPDLITFAKGVTSGYLPLSGTIVGERVKEVLESQTNFVLRTGYTYSGHPLCCAAGTACLEIIETENLMTNVANIENRLQIGLNSIKADGMIKESRVIGGMAAVDMNEGIDAITIRTEMIGKGVIVRPIGQTLAICPPLVITDDQLDQIVDTLAETLSAHQPTIG